MNLFAKVVFLFLFVTVMVAPAYAIEVNLNGYLTVRGLAYDNLDFDDASDDNARGVDQRFRLWTTGALNENVKAVLGLEIDSIWGDSDQAIVEDVTGNGKQVGKLGADAKGQLEVKHAYLYFKVPEIDTKFTLGTQGWLQARGLIINDDGAGAKIVKSMPGIGGDVALLWIKTEEGDKNDDSEDGDYYSLQFNWTADGWSVVPFYGYWDMQDSDKIHYLGLSGDGKVGDVKLSFSLIGNDWSIGDADGNGIATFAKASLPVGATTFSLQVGYMGDDDAPKGRFVAVSSFHQVSEVITGVKFSNLGTIGLDAVGAVRSMNFLYGKLSASHKLSERQSVKAVYVYAEQAADPAPGVDAITYGHEIDAYYTLKITDGLVATVGGGYLFTDDEAGPDNAWKLGSILEYKF